MWGEGCLKAWFTGINPDTGILKYCIQCCGAGPTLTLLRFMRPVPAPGSGFVKKILLQIYKKIQFRKTK